MHDMSCCWLVVFLIQRGGGGSHPLNPPLDPALELLRLDKVCTVLSVKLHNLYSYRQRSN
jgi:hypothetical protein